MKGCLILGCFLSILSPANAQETYTSFSVTVVVVDAKPMIDTSTSQQVKIRQDVIDNYHPIVYTNTNTVTVNF